MFIALYSAGVSSSINDLFDVSLGMRSFVIVQLISFAIIIVPVIFWKWFSFRRRLLKSVITAEYDPPLDLNPAEISCLFNGTFGSKEVAATVIHMVQRDLLKIKKVNGQKIIVLGSENDTPLKSYEKLIVDRVNENGGASINDLFTVFEGNSYTGNFMNRKMSSVVFNDMKRSRFATTEYKIHLSRVVLKVLALVLAAVVWVPFAVSTIQQILSTGTSDVSTGVDAVYMIVLLTLFAVPASAAVSLVAVLFRSRLTGREWIATPNLRRFWSQIVGYRQYVQLLEQEKLKFRSSKLRSASENDALPYGVALGFVKDWINIVS